MPGEVIILTNRCLSLSEWNQAIQAQDYIAGVVLVDEQLDAAEGRWHALLDGRPTSFIVREVPAARFPEAGSAPDGTPWRYAFAAIDEKGTRMPVAVAALLAYASETGGTAYDEDEGVVSDRTRLRMFADMHLSLETDRGAAFDKRYGVQDPPPAGPWELHVRLWKD